jgi:glycosyltransferase involved in cell wall biosynthesis
LESELKQRLGHAIRSRDLAEISAVRARLEDLEPDSLHTFRALAWEAQLQGRWEVAMNAWLAAHTRKPANPAPLLGLLRAAMKAGAPERFFDIYNALSVSLRFTLLRELTTNRIIFIENEVVRDFFNYANEAPHDCPLLVLWVADHFGIAAAEENSGAYDVYLNRLGEALAPDMLVALAQIMIRFREWHAAERLMRKWLVSDAAQQDDRSLAAEFAIGMSGLVPDYLATRATLSSELEDVSKKRVRIIDTGAIHYQTSHHYNSLQHMLAYLKETGFALDEVGVLTSLESRPVEGLGVAQSNALTFRTYAGVPHGDSLGRFPNRKNKWLRQDLDRLDVENVDLIVFKTVTPNMLKAVYNWLAEQDGKRSFSVIIDFLPVAYAPRELNREANARMAELVLQPFDKLAELRTINVLMHSEFSAVSEQLSERDPRGQVFKKAVYPVASTARAHRRPRGVEDGPRKIRVGMMGATREDKGYGVLPDLISLADDSNFPVEWRLQFDKVQARDFRDQPFMQADIDRLEQDPNVTIRSGFATQDEYYRAFAGLDVVLLPYSDRYQSSSSGIITEAIELNVLPVVPRGSTMEQIAKVANAPHIAIDEVSAEAIFAALKQYFIDAEDLLAMWEGSDLSAYYVETPMTDFLRREGLISTD